MLNSLYTTFFRPVEMRFSAQVAVAIGLLVVFILALNAAGAAGLGVGGIIGFTLLFLFAGLLGWFWLSAAVNLLAQLLGGQADGRATMSAIATGLYPLIFTAPAIAASRWSQALGDLFSFLISIAVFVTLTIAIHHVHEISWWKSIFCLAIAITVSLFALSGLILWPVMIILGM
ncbi:MAG: hypothetical protein N4J56_004218 [Chroococcidiopsis sp. SAG 2025]|uniref:YIP1 family protein n=1 Tax=Chroococcidiopsis sp. SAG 2025 TaxID=171389 RepID=UPI002937194F|nr:YIP1 family protein [Chroococcidiopsis sp. SAG 2025]MDV2994564.1 hypothetical protein [Chroococcidiopsis sp. SAG 2025]